LVTDEIPFGAIAQHVLACRLFAAAFDMRRQSLFLDLKMHGASSRICETAHAHHPRCAALAVASRAPAACKTFQYLFAGICG
jgi:Zn-dependent oligopeptidase